MSDMNERPVGSSGSQPVAWAVEFEGEVEPFCLSFEKSKAINEAGGVGRVFPLWRSPTLTDAEAWALQFLLRHAAWACDREAFPDSGDYRKHHDEVFRLLKRK